MKPPTKLNTSIACIAAITISFTSCKKDQAVLIKNNSTVSENSADNSTNNGMIAWFTFNGDVLDHSGHNNNIVFNSAIPAKGRSGVANTAYLFNGKNSYMRISNSRSLNPQIITLFAVIKPNSFYEGACHNNRIISKGYDDTWNGRYVLSFSDQLFYNYDGCHDSVATASENFGAEFGNGQSTAAGVVDTTDKISTDKWYTVAYTFDGKYSKLYVNGRLKARALKYTTFTPSSRDIFIGRNEGPQYPYYFNGVMDEIRIYNRALTAIEMVALYAETRN